MPEIEIYLYSNHKTYNIQAETTWEILCYFKKELDFHFRYHTIEVWHQNKIVGFDEKLVEGKYAVSIVHSKH